MPARRHLSKRKKPTNDRETDETDVDIVVRPGNLDLTAS
jgi:hypothetical protein